MTLEQQLIDGISHEPMSGCWLWAKGTNKYGYGAITHRRRSYYAHRVSWKIVNGDIPHGLLVCHKCDTPTCVNPRHLFLGTKKDNNADMWAKGRQVIARGSKVNTAKLNETQVAEIKTLLQSTRGVDVARMFGVGKDVISKIYRGKNWKHIEVK